MKLTNKLSLLIAGLVLSCNSLFAEFKPITMDKTDKNIAHFVTKLMEIYHYSKAEMNNDMSEKVFNEFFRSLDYNRRFFLKKDIEEFSEYEHLLDEMFKRGDLTFPIKLYTRYMQRLEERVAYLKKRVNEPFDFNIQEDYVLDRSEADWLESTKDLNSVWRKYMKNEILRMELSEILEKEKALKDKKEGKGKKSTEVVEEKKKPRTPAERLVKRFDSFLKYQSENDKNYVLEMALNIMTKCFDPHSNYFGAKAQEEFEISMKLSLIGIGATLQSDDGYTKIMSLVPGGPAHSSKQIKVNDRIVAVGQADDEPVDAIDMRLSKVVSMIRGKKGTVVALHVLRGGVHGQKHIIRITRDKIKLKESEAKGIVKKVKLGENKVKKVGVIHLPSFYADWDAKREGREAKSSTTDVRKILKAQIAEGIDSLIIDLRNNGGGSLPEAIDLTGLFIDKGPVVQIRQRQGRVLVRNDENAGTTYDGPLVVLVNEGSASASEIFAAAIQDYKRGVVVGTYRTHGKGTVQQVQALSRLRAFEGRDDIKPGQVKYTMAKFYRINGGSTQKKGVVPDIIMPSYAEQDDRGEATLRNVLEWDEIKSLNVEQNAKINNILPELLKLSKERLAKSTEFISLNKDIEFYKEKLEQKKISLNRKLRLTEFKKDSEIRKAREVLLKDLFGDKDEESAAGGSRIQDDVYLREALQIVSDLEDLEKRQAAK
jgi:carboxyl-terminal processing protease